MRLDLKTALVLLACALAGAQAACQGSACKEQQDAARAAGLLGGSLRDSCTPKTYPTTGTLTPVSELEGLGRDAAAAAASAAAAATGCPPSHGHTD